MNKMIFKCINVSIPHSRKYKMINNDLQIVNQITLIYFGGFPEKICKTKLSIFILITV